MTTTIQPATGAAPLYTQQGVGTTPGYSALDDRRQGSGPLQAGVLGSAASVTAGGVAGVTNADFMVTQRNAGANMSVDINMPAGGFAWVAGTTITGQGLYCVPVHTTNINEIIAGADPTNPRVDQVILEIQDNAIDASGGNLARTRVVIGTPQAGATLASRGGAPALPNNCLLLADVLVPAAATTVPNSNIRDRRKWARGASLSVVGSAAGNFTTTSTAAASLAAGAFDARLECSGAPLDIDFSCTVSHTVANGVVVLNLNVDGVANQTQETQVASAGETLCMTFQKSLIPAAGSHLLQWQWFIVTAGTGTIDNTGIVLPVVRYREQVRQSSANNTVTTG